MWCSGLRVWCYCSGVDVTVVWVRYLAQELPHAVSSKKKKKKKKEGREQDYSVPTPHHGNKLLGLRASILFT